ncbi:MAG: glycosyltransferase family 2 protein, partial [Patescibacteria group bacterium]
MNLQPLVSVIISTCNRANLIRKAVDSVLKQNYKNIELIIINDGSTDKTSEIISEAAEK